MNSPDNPSMNNGQLMNSPDNPSMNNGKKLSLTTLHFHTNYISQDRNTSGFAFKEKEVG
jgi:hypothetical protein